MKNSRVQDSLIADLVRPCAKIDKDGQANRKVKLYEEKSSASGKTMSNDNHIVGVVKRDATPSWRKKNGITECVTVTHLPLLPH